jgi:hypothetical protein
MLESILTARFPGPGPGAAAGRRAAHGPSGGQVLRPGPCDGGAVPAAHHPAHGSSRSNTWGSPSASCGSARAPSGSLSATMSGGFSFSTRRAAGPQSVLKLPQIAVKSQTAGWAPVRDKACVCGRLPSATFCLPCRRSRVRIPSAASKKVCICRPFFACAVGLCVCVESDELRTRPGPIVGRSKENPLFAGPFWFVRTQVLLRACRTSGVRLLRPLPLLLLQRHDPADSARRRDTTGRGLGGQSGFGPETRGQPRPAPR